METLLRWDKALLKLINNDWHNSVFDAFLPYIRIAEIWAPLYLFLLVFAIYNFKKDGVWWVLFFIVTVILTNIISSDIIKESVQRLRPCNNYYYKDWLRVLVAYRPQSSSFTSSHAANHFGLAAFAFFTLRKQIGKLAWLFFVWAASICYAQVYVGVHYPIDIIGGTCVGLFVGFATANFFNNYWRLQPFFNAKNSI